MGAFRVSVNGRAPVPLAQAVVCVINCHHDNIYFWHVWRGQRDGHDSSYWLQMQLVQVFLHPGQCHVGNCAYVHDV